MLKKVLLLTLIFVLFSTTTFADLTTDLLYYYTFDEASGNYNNSVNSAYGSLTVTGARQNVVGKIGKSVYFDGTNDNLISTTLLGTTNTQNSTVSFWTNSSVLTGDRLYLQFYNASFTSAQYTNVISIAQSGTKFSLQGAGTTSDEGVPKINVQNSNFVFVTMVNFNNNNTEFIYINGTFFGAYTNKLPLKLGATQIRIGERYDNNLDLNANMDELAIWNRTLSQAEITQLYNSGTGLQYPFSTTPISNNTCTYSGSDIWTVNIADNCTISTPITLNNTLVLNGTGGTFTVNTSMTVNNLSLTPTATGSFVMRILQATGNLLRVKI